MFDRIFDIESVLSRKSLFLLGPRQTGKSTFLKQALSQALTINLLDTRTALELMSSPYKLRDMIAAYKKSNNLDQAGSVIVIDEIQKNPLLLDEVHQHIENHPQDRFVLTGSSARRLKKSHANLLGGRARMIDFFPLVYKELKTQSFALNDILLWGALPSIVTSENKSENLYDYVHAYLNEEIKSEGLVRSLPTFSRFLELAARYNTEQIVYGNISSDVGLSSTTIKEYYQILEDTLFGQKLEPYRKTSSRKVVSVPKFYFFDVGVVNAILGVSAVSDKTESFGKLLEQYVYQEIRAYIGLQRNQTWKLYYWRTHQQHEVDFVIQNEKNELILVEVKATANVQEKHLKGMSKMQEVVEEKIIKKIIVCQESMERMLQDTWIMPVQVFLEKLWEGIL